MLVHSIQSLKIARNVSDDNRQRWAAQTRDLDSLYIYDSPIACCAGVSFRRANVFARENAMLKLPKRGENALN